ncbi:OFA family oxalate/formate antiporter-like MFS transporter [Desulfobotulus alkaliphilus]|uniref:OFA family oxalate/formate antiporter-like MFS transporter n=1 Tax=Desulfobotulus alkaliphilus TaxID=622671 RepID=A0A562R550_9BACT|nr:OFA family MFS transporter [Desulfobotulus alkaliphilus]TWI64171.1 OFA family oxalate/formate antiporter-like MFS transporter [Desulfobotulus alkaliphilus]
MEKKSTSRWLMVFVAFVMMLCVGGVYAWSLYNIPLLDANPGWNLGGVALTFGITVVFICFGGIIGGGIFDKVGFRKVATAGAILFGLGLMLSSTASKIWQLYLFYGVFAGLGTGLVYGPALATCIKWFPDKRGLISGIAVMGFGLGAMISKPIILFLIENYGVNNTFLYLGVIYCAILLVAAQLLVSPPLGYRPLHWRPFVGSAVAENLNFTTGQMVKTKQFYLIWLMFHFGCIAGLLVISVAVNIGTDLVKLDAVFAANVVVAIALFNAIGRIFWGGFSDKIGRIRALSVMFSLMALAMFLMGYIEMGYVSFLALGSLVGFCFGGFLSTFPALTTDYYGTENLGKNYGAVIFAFGVAGIVGTRLAGIFENDFTQAFHVAFVLCVLAVFMSFFVTKPVHKNAEVVVAPVLKAAA